MARTKTSSSSYNPELDRVISKVGFIETSVNGGVTACAIKSYDSATPKIVLSDIFPSRSGEPYRKPLLRLKLDKAKAIHELLTKAIKEYESKVDTKKYANKGIAKKTFNAVDYV